MKVEYDGWKFNFKMDRRWSNVRKLTQLPEIQELWRPPQAKHQKHQENLYQRLYQWEHRVWKASKTLWTYRYRFEFVGLILASFFLMGTSTYLFVWTLFWHIELGVCEDKGSEFWVKMGAGNLDVLWKKNCEGRVAWGKQRTSLDWRDEGKKVRG